jgi:hypothetical protein
MGGGQSTPGTICDHCAAGDIAGRTRYRPASGSSNNQPTAFSGGSDTCPIGGYFWWVYQYSTAIDSMYVFHEYAYTGRRDYQYIRSYVDYSNMVLREYYQDISDLFNSHPIGYILAGLEDMKNPEYENVVQAGAIGNDINSMVNGVIKNLENTKPYPPPGILCVTGYTIDDCRCSFDGQSFWFAGRYYKYGCAGSFCANDDHHLCGTLND